MSNNKTILVWDAQSGQIVCGAITEHEGAASSVCFSPDGKLVLSESYDNTMHIWDAIIGQTLFPPFGGHVHPIKLFASSLTDNTLILVL